MTIERTAFIAVGSNKGNRPEMILSAAQRLDELSPGLRFSPVFETRPLGPHPQQPYLNCVGEMHWKGGAYDLLRALQWIEFDLGRRRSSAWGERVIDLDILLVGDEVRGDTSLRLPHPGMEKRQFVLLPMACLVPRLRSSRTGRLLSDSLALHSPDGWHILFEPPEKRRGAWTMRTAQRS